MNTLMLLLGLFALTVGAVLLLRRGGSEQARVARRIGGAMTAALGLALIVFAVGLTGTGSAGNA